MQFYAESKEELQRKKELARQTIVPVGEQDWEIDIDEYFLPELDFPKRPPWNYELTKEQLDSREQNYLKVRETLHRKLRCFTSIITKLSNSIGIRFLVEEEFQMGRAQLLRIEFRNVAAIVESFRNVGYRVDHRRYTLSGKH